MKRFGQTFRLRGIAPKIFLLLFVCIEALTLAITYSYIQRASGILVDTQMKNARQTVQKSDRDLVTNLQNVRLSMSAILSDARLRLGEYRQLESWMVDSLAYLKPTLYNIHIVSNGQVLASTSSHSWDLLSDPVVVRALSDGSAFSSWIGPYYSRTSGYTMTYAASAQLQDGTAGTLLADINLESLYYSLIPDESSDVSGNLVLLGEDGKPVFGKAPYIRYDYVSKTFGWIDLDPRALLSGPAQTEAVNPVTGDRLILTKAENAVLPWQLMLVLDKNELLAPLHATVRYFWWIGALAFVVSVGLSLFMTAMLSRPIRSIAKAIKQAGDGNFGVSIPIGGRNDELGYLALRFNWMLRKIGQLLEDLKTTEEEKKRSDFRALQAQIKPHYLYNTLNAISMLGRSGDAERMDRLISALTNQLHYALDQSPDPVSLAEELASVSHYSELMGIRYPGRFRLELDIDPDALGEWLPKFILQPLVENAIFHGIVPSNREGTVLIVATAEDDEWELLIEDDGVGMDGTTLAALTESFGRPESASGNGNGSGHRIGVRNVYERFRLMFGDKVRIRFESRIGAGTRIWIRLPRGGGIRA